PGAAACGAPTVIAPAAAQSVGSALRVRTRATACLIATKCYVDGNPAPVATGGAGDLDAPFTAAIGSHDVSCNGWDGAWHAYTSPPVPFTVTACGAPAILSPAAGETVGTTLVLETSAPACLGTTKCYLDGNPQPVATGTGNLVVSLAIAAGPHSIA